MAVRDANGGGSSSSLVHTGDGGVSGGIEEDDVPPRLSARLDSTYPGW